MFRVHDVAELRQALDVADVILLRPARLAAPTARYVCAAWKRTATHESTVHVELRGLSIYTHHGVTDAEQEIGQRLVIDVSFDVPDCDAVLTDRLEDTIDYAEVADIVVLAATERSYRTLERLAGVIGERLMERFGSRLGARPGGEARAARSRSRSRRSRSRWCASARSAEPRRRGRARGRGVSAAATSGSARTSATGSGTCARRSSCSASTGSRSRAASSVYETEPVGEILDQPDFLNAAVAIATELEPGGAARHLQGDRGRAGADARRAQRHGPRPLDVDLLLLGDLELADRAADPAAPAR